MIRVLPCDKVNLDQLPPLTNRLPNFKMKDKDYVEVLSFFLFQHFLKKPNNTDYFVLKPLVPYLHRVEANFVSGGQGLF